jgi:hypothetical protein
MVDIREYYGDEGDEKPGKKGISLTLDQVRKPPIQPPHAEPLTHPTKVEGTESLYANNRFATLPSQKIKLP